MTYLPTTDELDEMGFKKISKNYYAIDMYDDVSLEYYNNIFSMTFSVPNEGYTSKDLFCKSKQDIETLIRLFTNN